MTDFVYNNVNFKLSNKCKKWFSLPERDVYDFIDEIHKNQVFYDLGACEGRFTVYSGKKNIKTYSFEPDCYNFNVLKENIELNKLNNVFIYKNAVSNVNKDLYLLKNQPWEGGHLKILENGERVESIENYKEKELVKTVKLDDFIKDNNLPYPDYIKVDVDGNEINFIEGSKNTLEYCKKIHIELTEDNKNIIINKLGEFSFKVEKIYDIYTINNRKYDRLYNYVFTK